MDSNQLSFLNEIKSTLTDTQITSSNVAEIYKSKIDQFVNRSDLRSICGPATGGGTPTPDPDSTCENERLVTGGLCCNPGRRPKADNSSCEDGPATDGTITVDGTPTPDPTPGTTETPTPTPPTTTNTCTAPKVAEGAAGACVDPCTAEQVRNTETFACDPKPATTNTCTEPQVAEGEEGACVDPCTDEQVRNTETFACDPKTDTAAVSLTVTGKNKDTNTTTVEAAISPATTDWSLYTLIWFSRGETRATDQNVSGTRTSPPTPDISTPDPGEETPEDHSRDLGDKESLLNRDDLKTFDAPRLANDYDVCARLVKKSDNSKTDEKCVKIPKKPVQAPRTNGMNPFQQPMMPTRGGASDATFRGVR
jgi:hypothetical protein